MGRRKNDERGGHRGWGDRRPPERRRSRDKDSRGSGRDRAWDDQRSRGRDNDRRGHYHDYHDSYGDSRSISWDGQEIPYSGGGTGASRDDFHRSSSFDPHSGFPEPRRSKWDQSPAEPRYPAPSGGSGGGTRKNSLFSWDDDSSPSFASVSIPQKPSGASSRPLQPPRTHTQPPARPQAPPASRPHTSANIRPPHPPLPSTHSRPHVPPTHSSKPPPPSASTHSSRPQPHLPAHSRPSLQSTMTTSRDNDVRENPRPSPVIKQEHSSKRGASIETVSAPKRPKVEVPSLTIDVNAPPREKSKPSFSLSGFGKGLVAKKIRTIAEKTPSLGINHEELSPSVNVLPPKSDALPSSAPPMSSQTLALLTELESLPSKADILSSIQGLDEGLASCQDTIQRARQRLEDLENAARRKVMEEEEAALEAKFRRDIQVPEELFYSQNPSVRIYAENSWKAQASRESLLKVAPKWMREENENYAPRYFRISECELYRQNTVLFTQNEKKFLAVLARRKSILWTKKLGLKEQWKAQHEKWAQVMLERLKEQKIAMENTLTQEQIEKVVRVGHGEANAPDWESLSAPVTEQILDEDTKKSLIFVNTNGFVADPKEDERIRKTYNPWSEEEKVTFRKKYFKHGKNFARIAAALPRKTHNECVAQYYLTKHSLEGNKYFGTTVGKRYPESLLFNRTGSS